MSFKKNKYTVLKTCHISPDVSRNWHIQYFLNKRKVARVLFDERYISQFTTEWGVWNDQQIPETYSHYSDVVNGNIITKIKTFNGKRNRFKVERNIFICSYLQKR